MQPDLEEGMEDPPELKAGSYVRVDVADTGRGMDEHTRSRAFEPFFTTKAPSKGTGLGLATAYGIVQQHGGAVTVESTPGAGTRFSLYFPVWEGEAEEVSEAEAGPPRTTGSERILVVEDEDVVRRLVVNVLRRHGYEVLDAAGPGAALELVADPETSLDLLVTDVVMPEMDGVEMYRRMSATRPDLPVLYLSGYAHDVIAEKGVTTMNLLAKPFSLRDLTDRVQRFFESG